MAFLNKKIETMSETELKNLQIKKFKNLISYSYEHCKPVRKLMEKENIKPSDIQTIEDIDLLPIMDKDYLLQLHHQLLISKENQ